MEYKFTNLTIIKYCDILGIDISDFDKSLENVFKSNNVLVRASVDVATKGETLLNEYEADELIENMTDDEYIKFKTDFMDSISGIVSRLTTGTSSKKK